jgi:UDP-4-amino-4,6-dideoxy-N-acetyl-beta-L-altrosamine transaminase
MRSIPYSRQDVSEGDIQAVCAALRSDFLTQGSIVPAFENEFARLHGASRAVAVSNATAALHIACLALDVGPGSRVWTSPNSFVASANCALYCGAEVGFVDIDPATRCMSVELLKAKLAESERAGALPQVVIPVDFAGLPSELREIRALADHYGFKVLEDASHATGAEYGGRPVGGQFSHACVFSFHAVKIITTAEGGIVTTQDDAIAERLRLLRSHGTTRDAAEMERPSEGAWYYEQHLLGFNYRLTELQAALGLSQLKRIEELRGRREDLAERYDRMLADLPVILPARRADRRSAWHLYVVEIEEQRTSKTRKEVFEHLRRAGIGVNVHYIPIHTQPFYRRLGFKRGDFPNSERYYERAITLPLFPALTHEQQQFVADSIAAAFD